jgi:hypothetical protein
VSPAAKADDAPAGLPPEPGGLTWWTASTGHQAGGHDPAQDGEGRQPGLRVRPPSPAGGRIPRPTGQRRDTLKTRFQGLAGGAASRFAARGPQAAPGGGGFVRSGGCPGKAFEGPSDGPGGRPLFATTRTPGGYGIAVPYM